MKTKYQVFEGTVQSALKTCLEAGFRPLTLKEVWMARDKKLIPWKFYDSSTIFLNGTIRDATMNELKNIEKFYDKGGVIIGSYCNGSLHTYSGFGLVSSGRFVGILVMKEEQRTKHAN